MYWQEEDDTPTSNDDIVDLVFKIDCRELPVDHAWALSRALHAAQPKLGDIPNLALLPVHVSEYGNGWQRPEGEDATVYPSRRARMGLRVRRTDIAEVSELEGTQLDVAGFSFTIGKPAIRDLVPLPTLQTRYMVCDAGKDENQFIEEFVAQVKAMQIPVRKLLCGKAHRMKTPDGIIHSRTVMLADLSKDHSLILQQQGLGPHRQLGCGVFIPQKGIDAVARPKDKES